jgi:uncharacterized membrane protein (UPF0127 family)
MTRTSFVQIASVLFLLTTHSAYSFSARDTYCVAATPELKQMEQRRILLSTSGKPHSMTIHIADQPSEQAAGFQFVCPDAYANTQILFVYNQEISVKFHMRNVRGSLDIGFFDMNGNLIEVHTMQPYPAGAKRGPITGPSRPFRFALEAQEGYFDANQLLAGKTTLQWVD